MAFSTLEFLARADLDRATLEIWIEDEWLIPRSDGDDQAFSEGDLARVRFIRDLMSDLGINAEGVGVVLHLVDQVHGLRRALAELAVAGRTGERL